jgi:hypothetical protein
MPTKMSMTVQRAKVVFERGKCIVKTDYRMEDF